MVVINKLDAMGFDKSVYDSLVAELQPTVERLGLSAITYIPVSALEGDNVVYKGDRISWYSGGSLLEEIQNWREKPNNSGHSRMGVQLISRAENFRGVSGTVSQGEFSVGDEVIVLPSQRKAKVSKLVTFDGELSKAATAKP